MIVASVPRFIASVGKRLARAAGFSVRRAGPVNRFDGMADALWLLRTRGYAPRVVIDGGANVGTWTRMASVIFPDATFHLIEPQTACHPKLADLRPPRYHVHPYALTRSGVMSVTLASVGGAGVSTGAHVVEDPTVLGPEVAVASHSATTLDALFATTLTASDRAFLKLDIEGHELEALKGAGDLLSRVEVVLCEVTFVDFYKTGHVLFEHIHDHLRDRGFELHDFAALSPRPRDQRLRQGRSPLRREGKRAARRYIVGLKRSTVRCNGAIASPAYGARTFRMIALVEYPSLDRNADDAATARFDDVGADDGAARPVGALDENVGLQRADTIACGVSSSKITTASTQASAARTSARSVFRVDRPVVRPCPAPAPIDRS